MVGLASSLGSIGWTCLTSSRRRQRRLRGRADRSLAVAQRAFLRDKLAEASMAVEAGLHSARSDVDLLFIGWQVARQRGEVKHARKYLRRLRSADVEGKWDWEVKMGEEQRV